MTLSGAPAVENAACPVLSRGEGWRTITVQILFALENFPFQYLGQGRLHCRGKSGLLLVTACSMRENIVHRAFALNQSVTSFWQYLNSDLTIHHLYNHSYMKMRFTHHTFVEFS